MTKERQRHVVAACCDRAAEVGVCAGMPLAQARALFATPSVRIETHDPSADTAALRGLAVWAQRFSPVVAVDEPDGLLLDATGCARVWGGEDRLLRAMIADLERLGFAVRAAITPTFGCAWAVSRFGAEQACLVRAAGIRDVLAPLPVEALRVNRAAATQLGEVGIERIGDLLELPRSTLPPRFGSEVLLRLDEALGQAMETIEPIRPVPPPAVERVFDGPTDRIEAVELTVREFLGEIEGELERRCCGARRLDVELTRSDLGPEHLAVTLGRPCRDAEHLWRLLRPKLERAHLGFGVEGVRVCVPAVGKIVHEQAECTGVAGRVSAADVERSCSEMFDTLQNRFGEGRVLRASLRESRVPERAFEMRDASDPTGVTVVGLACARPSVLFDRPFPAEVIALTPSGPVHRLTWRDREHRIIACVGPERIGGEWWRATDRTRDYFAARDDRGQWFWLARGVESGRWFVHGVWA